MALVNKPLIARLGPINTGLLTGVANTTLGVQIVDAGTPATVLYAFSSAGIIEDPAGSGEYKVIISGWNSSWNANVRWFKGNGSAPGNIFVVQEIWEPQDNFASVVWNAICDGTLTFIQTLRKVMAAVAGKAVVSTSVNPSDTVDYKREDGTTGAFRVIHDGIGNRTTETDETL